MCTGDTVSLPLPHRGLFTDMDSERSAAAARGIIPQLRLLSSGEEIEKRRESNDSRTAGTNQEKKKREGKGRTVEQWTLSRRSSKQVAFSETSEIKDRKLVALSEYDQLRKTPPPSSSSVSPRPTSLGDSNFIEIRAQRRGGGGASRLTRFSRCVSHSPGIDAPMRRLLDFHKDDRQKHPLTLSLSAILLSGSRARHAAIARVGGAIWETPRDGPS